MLKIIFQVIKHAKFQLFARVLEQLIINYKSINKRVQLFIHQTMRVSKIMGQEEERFTWVMLNKFTDISAGIYLLKVNNRNTRTKFLIPNNFD